MTLRWVLGALLILPGFSTWAAASEDAAEWRYEDPTGDVSATFVAVPGTPGQPSSAANRHVDITAVTIGEEDANGLAITFHFDQLKVGPPPSNFLHASYLSLRAEFQVTGSDLRYYLSAGVEGVTQASTDAVFVASEEAYGSLWACNRSCLYDDSEVTVSEGQVRLWLTKAGILGLTTDAEDRPTGLPASVGPGAQLKELRFRTSYSAAPFVGYADYAPELPDFASPYNFQVAAANDVIRLSLPDSRWGLSVQSNVNQSLPLVVENLADAKRLIQVQYELVGPKDKLGNYAVHGPTTLTVPPASTRNFTYALNVKPEARADDGVQLVISSKSVAHDELGYAKTRLVPGLSLGPDSNMLHFLTYPVSYVADPVDPVLCADPGIFFTCGYGFLSIDPNDPEGVPDRPLKGSLSGLGLASVQQSFWLALNRPTTGPVNFDPTKPVELELSLRAPLAAEQLVLTADLSYYSDGVGEGTIFNVRETIAIGASPTTIKISAPTELGADSTVLPRGTYLSLRMDIRYPEGSPAFASWAAGGIELLPQDSHLRLPLVELPDALRTEAVDTPFQLSPVGDAVNYVNPGESRLFNVSVLHQGTEQARVRVTAEPGLDWDADVLPGSQYDLMPGDAVTVGVLVHTPDGVKENERREIRVNATDAEGNVVGLLLTLYVTSSIDFADDAGRFSADPDALAKQAAPKGGNSPGPELLLVLVSLAAVALRRRKA